MTVNQQPPSPRRRCLQCGVPSSKRCGRCKTAKYCSSDCQQKHWKAHKEHCLTWEYRALENDPTRFFIVAIAQRRGVYEFFDTLERRFYAPGTEANGKFYLGKTTWRNLDVLIGSVPLEDAQQVKDFAPQCAIPMRIAGGVFTFFGGGDSPDQQHFPLQGPNVWTLENSGRSGYAVYTGPKVSD